MDQAGGDEVREGLEDEQRESHCRVRSDTVIKVRVSQSASNPHSPSSPASASQGRRRGDSDRATPGTLKKRSERVCMVA